MNLTWHTSRQQPFWSLDSFICKVALLALCRSACSEYRGDSVQHSSRLTQQAPTPGAGSLSAYPAVLASTPGTALQVWPRKMPASVLALSRGGSGRGIALKRVEPG